jgi:hypothetical protein
MTSFVARQVSVKDGSWGIRKHISMTGIDFGGWEAFGLPLLVL